ncbi:MAG: UvrD-helicase domain-containing protein, partial [Candidatus Poribacteria bacterium]|nr:UvrD-helicase domain-containing protein [Candidatus Poribacteria bacterium]
MKLTLNQKKALDIERHIALTAGAGSGKTAVLVNRYIEILIKKNLRVGQVVAITFTEKAAAELRQRILREIENRISDGRDVEKLIGIKGSMISAQISTIHAFCSRILREHPIEANVDIGFRVIDGIEQRISVRSAIKSILETIAEYPNDDPSYQRLAILLRIFGEKRLEQIITKFFSRRYAIDRLSDKIYQLSDDQILSYWQQFVQDQLSQVIEKNFPIEDWIDHLNITLTIAKGRNAKTVRDLVDKLDANRNLQKNILILNQISDLVLTKDKKNVAKQNFFGKGTEIEEFKNQVQFLVKAGQTVKKFPFINSDDRLLVAISHSLVEIYCRVRDHYDTRNAQQGVLDFDDILVKAKTLLQNQVIRNRLAQRYAYIMVDEYQDTNTLQYEILKPIISDFSTGNFFIVGDQKQSIYGFRDADVRVFQQTTNEIIKYQEKNTSDFKWDEQLLSSTQQEKCGTLHLAENFRLLSNLVAFVNLLFEQIMGYELENEFEVRYDPLIKGRSNNASGNIELLLGSETQNEHQLIAARIHHMIDTEVTVWERNNMGEIERPIRYSDIAVLIRNRTHLPQNESQFIRAEIPY